MKRTAVRVFIVGSFLVALAVFVALPGAAQEAGQKKQKKEDPLTRSQRAEINYVLVIEEGEDLEGLLAEPVEGLEEKILTAIEQEHDITLKRTSMVKTEKCLHD